ncbi:hypothetical protein [Proteiniphilum sp. X52]|uniref:hypothetical protein n=1 Tax=Proteiniphilum sp. X52 TaxID=2382159 RepID=UPI000F0A2579|nr:hypothetical protein [Proteiniphilum sp. X52]RNC66131.1 hypothetical protein D7D25_04130 [Proteiniphilum sp. X52]
MQKFINSVMAMNPVEYNLKQVDIEPVGDTASVPQKLYDLSITEGKDDRFGRVMTGKSFNEDAT